MPGSDKAVERRAADFFVSYTQSDERWAEWIGWVLEDAGYRVVIQAWDFGPGSHFVAEMHQATQRAARTIAVMSAAYEASVFAAEEWQAAWAADPDGRARRLLALRVEDCPRKGLLRQLVSVDLFGIDRETAKKRLLAAVRGGRRKPEVEPLFPDGGGAGPVEPLMPVPPRVWRLAWSRNPNFVGRADELALVRERFTTGAGAAAVLPQAVHGLGGVGKTQLAVEYAYRHTHDYELVWWVAAEQPELVVAGLAELASRLGVAVPGAAQESAAAAVEELRSGRRFSRWLVVADNAGGVWDLAGLLGAAGERGHVLITSRDPGWSQATRMVAVDVLPRAQAVTLLQARAPRLTGGEAEQVAEVLGDLPLALEQAGAWLAESGMSASTYLDAVDTRTREIFAEGRPHTYPVPVAATWTLALDTLDDTAVGLLRLWAFLGPEPIPTDWITDETAAAFPSPLAELADPVVRGRTVAAIVRLALVRLVDGAVVMHRLVQAVLRDQTPEHDRDSVRRIVLQVLIAAVPPNTGNPAEWPRWAAIHPHALAINLLNFDHSGALDFVVHLCDYLYAAGNYSASSQLAEATYERVSQEMRQGQPGALEAAAQLGNILSWTGNHAAALEVRQAVLVRRQGLLGNSHSATIIAMAQLADTLWSTGKQAAARALMDDVLDRYSLAWQAEEVDSINATLAVAAALRSNEDALAREMFEELLARCRRVLGEDHHTTVIVEAHLSGTWLDLKEYSNARELQLDVIRRFERTLGDDAAQTIAAIAHLSRTLAESGDITAARDARQTVLNRYERLLGKDHPNTIDAAARLAAILRELGDDIAARAIQEDVLARRRRSLGDDHSTTIAAAADLATTLWALGQYTEARNLQQDVAARWRRMLGDDHPVTIQADASLAAWNDDHN